MLVYLEDFFLCAIKTQAAKSTTSAAIDKLMEPIIRFKVKKMIDCADTRVL